MHVTGTMAGWFLVGGSIGGMTLPWGIGQAFVRTGAGAMITIVLVAVILNLLALILFIWLPVRHVSIMNSAETNFGKTD